MKGIFVSNFSSLFAVKGFAYSITNLKEYTQIKVKGNSFAIANYKPGEFHAKLQWGLRLLLGNLSNFRFNFVQLVRPSRIKHEVVVRGTKTISITFKVATFAIIVIIIIASFFYTIF